MPRILPMRVIVVASRKGGAGKTTLATHLAVEAERAGAGPVGVVDTDAMHGLAHWWDRRTAASPILAHPLPNLAAALDALRGQGVRLVFVDTPPQLSTDVSASVGFADLVVVPVQPSPDDLAAVGVTVELIQAARRPMVFVLNRTKPRVRLTGQAAINLSQHGTVAPVEVADRAVYAGAKVDGRTAPELDPAGLAAGEMTALWSYLDRRLEAMS
ncbi:MAG TPA: ParA family protein [Acetobacteraceae bacterium]